MGKFKVSKAEVKKLFAQFFNDKGTIIRIQNNFDLLESQVRYSNPTGNIELGIYGRYIAEFKTEGGELFNLELVQDGRFTLYLFASKVI
jgi:hypothetical protein